MARHFVRRNGPDLSARPYFSLLDVRLGAFTCARTRRKSQPKEGGVSTTHYDFRILATSGRSHVPKELRYFLLKPLGNFFDVDERYISNASLNSTVISPVQSTS